MELITSILALVFFVSVAGIIKPFKPFNRRRNALLSAGVCVLLVGFAGSSQIETNPEKIIDTKSPPQKEKRKIITREQLIEYLTKTEGLLVEGRYLDANEQLIQAGYRVLDEDRDFFNETRDEIRTRMANLLLQEAKANTSDFGATVKSLKAAYEQSILYVSRQIAQEIYEPEVLGFVKSIPASELENNEAGYRLLHQINPSNKAYLASAEKYSDLKLQAILGSFRSSHDKISKTTFYTHASAPRYLNSRSTTYLYIGRSENTEWLRLKTIYTSNDWLFVDRVIAYADGQTTTLTSGRFERDNGSGDIWEWLDESPSTSQISALRMLADADDAMLRYEGSQYRRDIQLRSQDKRAILETLEAFERLKEM